MIHPSIAPWAITLPTGEAPSQAYADFGRDHISGTATATAAGTATVILPTVPNGEYWLLEHAVVRCLSTAASTARFYLDNTNLVNQMDYTAQGNEDVADWPHGLFVPAGSTLLIVWTGADAAAAATASIVRHIYRMTVG